MSKQISLRVSDKLHADLAAAAERDHRSLNGQAVVYIERGVILDTAPATDRETRTETP
jgi:hypothetical protein